jgi:hypothetical protein
MDLKDSRVKDNLDPLIYKEGGEDDQVEPLEEGIDATTFLS